MDEKSIIEALKKAKEASKKRNFAQSVDLIITLKGLDMKKPDNQVDLFIVLHHPKGKESKVCALIGPETKESAKTCDKVILEDEFKKYQTDKKLLKNLVNDYDFFIAQANLMPKIATTFGRVLGPNGKMPNPKAGCVVPPKANLGPVVEKLKNTIRASAKVQPMIQCIIGKEDMDEKQIVDNILTVYKQIASHVPNESNNIKSVLIKLTMGKPVKV
ncbi:50S ribosomal protein L1 [Nanoarchaeota archaeon]